MFRASTKEYARTQYNHVTKKTRTLAKFMVIPGKNANSPFHIRFRSRVR